MSREWAEEVSAFTRAFAGAAVFGIPLVFTMEMWWIGKSLSLNYLLVAVGIGFVTNFGLARVSGFRDEHSLIKSIDQAIDALAVGVVSATVLLFTINQLRSTDGIEQGVGTIILLSIPLSLGASIARQVFAGRTSQGGEDDEDEDDGLTVWQGLASDVGATIIGGVFIGMTIAPTDEVKMIAAGLTRWHLFAVILLSLLLSYIIVFASDFDEKSPPGPFQHPASETMLAYVLSLLVALGMLLLLERVTLDDPLNDIVTQTVVLALPATIGGAGGRLVI